MFGDSPLEPLANIEPKGGVAGTSYVGTFFSSYSRTARATAEDPIYLADPLESDEEDYLVPKYSR